MSKEQIKKDLTMQLGVVKMKLKQLVFIEEQTGIRRTEEINALLDRLNLIEKILKDKVVDVIFRRTGQYFLSAQVEAFTTIRQERVFDIAYVSSHGIIARLPALALEIVHDVADGH